MLKKMSITKGWTSALIIFYAFSIVIFCLQQNNFDAAVTQGLVIPDVVNITNTLDLFWQMDDLFQSENQFKALSLLYGWTWLIHPSLCFLVNSVLIFASFRVYKKIATSRNIAPCWLIAGLLGNPYLILAMPGPNKEIPLLFLTACYFQLVTTRNFNWFIFSAILCAIMVAIRDGYGVFLLFSLFLILMLRNREQFLAPVICTLLLIATAFYGVFESMIPILSRNREMYEAISADQAAVGALVTEFNLNPYSPVDGLILFGFRLLYNLVSLAFFPVWITLDGNMYWIGICYWLTGLLIFTLILINIINAIYMIKVKTGASLAIGISLGVWFMISMSLFVQPRYFMPVLPIAFLAISATPIKLRYLVTLSSVIVTFSVISINIALDRSPPPASPEYLETPAYVWQG